LKLSTLLTPQAVVSQVKAPNLEGAILEILRRAEKFHPEETIEAIHAALLRREAQGSTALAHGIAVPHARMRTLNDFHVLLGAPSAPLEDKGHDGQPVDLVFVIISSDQKNTVMLQTMAAVAAIGKDEELLTRLHKTGTREELWRLIDESEIRVKKGLCARDLMRETPIVVQEDMLLRDLLDELFKKGVHKAPVCGANGEILGAVTSEEIVDAGFPDYMEGMQDIAFLSEYEAFERFFRREATTRVGDIANRNPVVVSVDDPIIQVVFRLKQERQRFAYVQENGRYVGVIDRADVISRILRA